MAVVDGTQGFSAKFSFSSGGPKGKAELHDGNRACRRKGRAEKYPAIAERICAYVAAVTGNSYRSIIQILLSMYE